MTDQYQIKIAPAAQTKMGRRSRTPKKAILRFARYRARIWGAVVAPVGSL